MRSSEEPPAEDCPRIMDPVGSAVRAVDVGEKEVTLSLPADITDCKRHIPQDLVEFGNETLTWFAWDMSKKQPRSPATNLGYAGTVRWGERQVDQFSREGTTFSDCMASLGWRVNGYLDQSWEFRGNADGTREAPRPLYPMMIIPHSKFSPDPGMLLLDFDDVIRLDGDESGYLSREAWDILCDVDTPGFLSSSKTGMHVMVRGRVPECIDGVSVELELDQRGKIEVFGYPGDGRVIGQTWCHINETPSEGMPNATEFVAELADEYARPGDKLSEEEQREAVLDDVRDRRKAGETGLQSPYFGVSPLKIANRPPFSKHARETVRGQNGPHPAHGGTSSKDRESTNFLVDDESWNCFVPGHGGGSAIHLVAVEEGIRQCSNVADLYNDSVDVLRACLAARDKHYPELEDADPPTQALRGVLAIQGYDYPDDGKLPYRQYELARELYDAMQYTGGGSA